MFFEKPNIKYVDMCIYIDEHIYTNTYDQELVYKYLFHIIMMLTMKRDYFSSRQDMEEFSLFAASSYYTRLTDDRQFGENPSLEKIRSVLNYIRKTLFSIRREYCKKYMFEKECQNVEFVSIDTNAFSNYVSQKVDHIGRIDFKHNLGNTDSFVREYLKTIPYEYGTTMWTNIYISCLLSLLNSITLKNKDIKRIEEFKRPNSLTDTLLSKLYMNERYSSTILYHLDDSMYNYITVLTNRIRHKLSTELSCSLHTYISTSTTMKNLLMSDMTDEE